MSAGRRILIIGVVLVALAATGLIVGSNWMMNSLPVSEGRVAKLQEGMTKAAVKDLLGPPTSISNVSDEAEHWKYSSRWKWVIFDAHFAADGTLTEFSYDR